jgi:hypothetical protein
MIERSKVLMHKPCCNDDQLHDWLTLFLGIHVPRHAVCEGHCAPFDYIRAAYYEPGGDLVVWAPRGGGKTRLAAAATLLDLLHKPGCGVRILGGSLEQSFRMWEHLLPDVERIAEDQLQKRTGSSRRLTLTNGASAAVLTQSQRAVRGLRVQKLRCDEVEMFEPEIWDAGQLTTKSLVLSDERRTMKGTITTNVGLSSKVVSGAIEALSTFHRSFGLMNRIVEQAQARGTPIIRWCVLEVLERCPAERDCATCPLWGECQGVAKTRCNGFMSIDDAIVFKKRVSREMWESEMLCKRPSLRGCVFPNFDSEVHVRSDETPAGRLCLAVDFGFANPFVCLWIVQSDDGRTFVIDEYVQEGRTVRDHVEQIRSRPWGAPAQLSCDPAGQGRNDQTAKSNVNVLRAEGFNVKSRGSLIVDGLEMIRAELRPAFGPPRLFVHPRCKRLIRAMQSYHYAEGGSELPLKDGDHDHLVDALRYHYVNVPKEEGGLRRY